MLLLLLAVLAGCAEEAPPVDCETGPEATGCELTVCCTEGTGEDEGECWYEGGDEYPCDGVVCSDQTTYVMCAECGICG